MKPKPRFKNPEHILARIERYRELADKKIKEAQTMEHDAQISDDAHVAYLYTKEAIRLRKRASQILAVTLPALGRKLATMRTMILPGVDIDRSIPQRLDA